MSSVGQPTPAAQEFFSEASSVLSTLNADGSRRWLNPRPSHGSWWRRRRAVAYILIAIFVLIPYIQMQGKPLVLLDLATRRFTLFGTTFLPTDTLLLALLMVGIFLTIFWLTALFGRVWCGWGCPQTVYLEFVYRPIERLCRGTPGRPKKTTGVLGMLQQSSLGVFVQYALYVLVSLFIAHTFLSYFVGVEKLATWVTRSPFENPGGFFIVAAVTGLMLFDFGFFREQTCLVACPYGRFQSALLDRHSRIVSYDPARGEPRGMKKHVGDIALPIATTPSLSGRSADCVDCKLCVATCPTGIDIRNGLQMECVHCTQCIDACDAVMTKLDRPPGLIRYSSQAGLSGEKFRLLRPRVLLYPTIIAIIATIFVLLLINRAPVHVSLQRGTGAPFYTLPDGRIANPVRIKLINKTNQTQTYTLRVTDGASTLVAETMPVTLEPSNAATVPATLMTKPDGFTNGERIVSLELRDASGYSTPVHYRMMGPGTGHHIRGAEPADDDRSEHENETKKEKD